MDIILEKVSELIEFDVNISRKDLLNILIKEKLISNVFEYLSDDEKKEYFPYININSIINYLKNFEFEEMLKILNNKIELFNNCDLCYICIELVYIKDIKEYLKVFSHKLGHYYTYKIINSIKNDDLKKELIDKYLINTYYYSEAISTLSDEDKEKYLSKTNKIEEKVNIILSFDDKRRIEKYAYLTEYSNYKELIIASTENKEFILESFSKIKINKDRINLINKINDEKLKLKLINLLDDNIKCWFLTNIEEIPNILKKLNGTHLDPEMTFGIELECSNKNIENYININKIYNDYKIVNDISVKNGFEIVSPILKYNINDLNKLKNVCDLLSKTDFYTDETTGGHIHIGASYFDKKEDFYMLLYLYINTEDILYYISDREYSIKRKNVDRYASKISQTYLNAIDNGLFENNTEEIKDLFDEINKTKHKGLNFKNLNSFNKNTIEFRMPNGEINFEELLLNIKLFARLVEMSHKLNELDNTSDIKIMAKKLGKCNKEKDRLEIILNILFDNEFERQKYRDRYFANKRLYLLKFKNLLREFKTNLKTTELVEIVEDSHLVRSKH